MPKKDTATTLEHQAAADSGLEELPEFTEAAMAPALNGHVAEEAIDLPEAWFEISADVKAVRGKNTSDGPALEIVLDASIDSHVGDIMGLIGRQFTRVRFRPYVYQQPLPTPAPETDAEDDDEADE